jgi:hypothetical protein
LQLCLNEVRLSEKGGAKSSKSSVKPKGILWLLPLAVFMGLLVIRIPFLSVALTGEEGMFAYLAINNGHDVVPKLLIGRLDGKDMWSGPSHPIAPYLFLVRFVRPLSSGMDYQAMSLKEKSVVARVPFFSLFCIALLALAILGRWQFAVRQLKDLAVPLGAIAFIGSSAPMVWGSVQPQLDGSWGVMLVGLSTLCLHEGMEALNTWRRIGLAFLSGMIAAMGKNEWAIAYLAALGVGLLVAVILRRPPRNGSAIPLQPGAHLVLGAASGLLFGTLFSISMDQTNYFAGFNIMARFGLDSSYSWLQAFLIRCQKMWHLFPLVALSGWVLHCHRKALVFRRFPLLVILLWGLFLCGGYIGTAWSPHVHRYFCLGYFCLLCFITAGLKEVRIPRITRCTLAAFFLAGTCLNAAVLFRQYQRTAIQRERSLYTQLAQFQRDGKPQIVGAALGYYFPKADFVSNSLGEAKARKLLERRGK